MTMAENSVFLPVAVAYDRWSRGYDAYDNPMVAAARHVLGVACAGLAVGTVVEFGCGTGRNLAALKAAGAGELIGCDLSEGMLEQARARDASFRLFKADMAAQLPIESGIADLVLFCLALEHVGDLVPPLREARRLMRSGGRVVIIEIHPFLSSGGVAAHFRDGEDVVHMPTFAHRFSDYLAALAAAGLALPACREWYAGDFGVSASAKMLKRGPDSPLVVEFVVGAG
jgi:malonyl-CoA O-methyltransferase